MTFAKHSGLRERYLSTSARVMLVVSWPAKIKRFMLSLIASSDITTPSSFGVVSMMASRSFRGVAFPCSSSYAAEIQTTRYEGFYSDNWKYCYIGMNLALQRLRIASAHLTCFLSAIRVSTMAYMVSRPSRLL